MRGVGAGVLGTLALLATGLPAQEPGHAFLDRIATPPLRFTPPDVRERQLAGGVTVFFLQDSSLPLVDVFARFRGGYGRFPRELHAAGTALPHLLRTGGTREMTPDSVERVVERYALQLSVGGSGSAVTASLNTLAEHLPAALEFWGAMLGRPRFDTARVAVWRGQEGESVRRRLDDPARLAFAEFNRLLYGDHPVGWEMTEEDLDPARLTVERFRWLHERIVCPDNLVLGVAGDVRWEELRPLLERMVEALPPCAEPLPPPPTARVGAPAGVYLLPRPVNQSTVVLAHPVRLAQDTSRAYFASRVGNTILGAGGFSSRLLTRVRTREGLAYGASSLWTTPREYDGLLGATTRTRSEATVRTIRLVLETMAEMALEPPTADEVGTVVDETVNGWVFNFGSPAQIVSRHMAFRAAGLPDDWLEAYLRGLRAVTPEDVRSVFADHLRPEDMVILVVGDPEAMDSGLEALGPVRILGPDGGPRGGRPPAGGPSAATPPPSAGPRSPR
ncbi:MAG: pitrilysin family protein [Longimicrobiales bacterium]|nr:pitrilysin family protein [Longimicrobiales bacterium]